MNVMWLYSGSAWTLLLSMQDEDYSPWTVPVGVCERLKWGVSLPLVALHHFTTPDCRRPRFRRWYLITFIMSMAWIAAYSYLMVWMITVIGKVSSSFSLNIIIGLLVMLSFSFNFASMLYWFKHFLFQGNTPMCLSLHKMFLSYRSCKKRQLIL